jgi:hypothetical protein
MRNRIRLLVVNLSILLFSGFLFGQDCGFYFKEGSCGMDLQKGYKIYSQSKGIHLAVGDTININVVFYGQKDYSFIFCTEKALYPVHFRIVDPETGVEIYDNSEDRNIESLGIGFDVTRNLTFKIEVLGEAGAAAEADVHSGCLGMLIQYKNYKD